MLVRELFIKKEASDVCLSLGWQVLKELLVHVEEKQV